MDEAQTQTIIELIKKAKVGPKFLKYTKARSVEEAGSLEAAVATIAARDYRKAVSALDRTQERKARPFSRPDKWAGRALLSCLLCWILVPLRTYSRLAGEIGRD